MHRIDLVDFIFENEGETLCQLKCTTLNEKKIEIYCENHKFTKHLASLADAGEDLCNL